MVSHFQTLFDVTSLAGVYPRMNEVYTRLGEMTNTMRNLREVLDLGNLQLDFELRMLRSQLWKIVKQEWKKNVELMFVVWCQTEEFLLLRWWTRWPNWFPPVNTMLVSIICWEMLTLTGSHTYNSHILLEYQQPANPKLFLQMFFSSLQYHHQSEAAWWVLPCFPCSHYRHSTDSR